MDYPLGGGKNKVTRYVKGTCSSSHAWFSYAITPNEAPQQFKKV